MSDLLALMTSMGFSPRKASANNGGEYVSACPKCGDGSPRPAGDPYPNRFHIWPSRDGGGMVPGRFWCRNCGINGDTIAFLQQIGGMSFPEACRELGVTLPGKESASAGRRYQPPPTLPTPPTWQPTTYPEPPAQWREKAGNFLNDCHERLMNDAKALEWLAARGIPAEAARAYRLGFNLSSKGKDRYRPRQAWGLPEKMQDGKPKMLWLPSGWVIPSFNRHGELVHLRIRRRDEDVAAFCGNIRYLPVDGSSMATMVLHPKAEVFAVVESGFDAVLLAWTMGGKIGAMTTWNSSARPDAWAHQLLERASLILGGLDYDNGGDREQDWWRAHYHHYRRMPPLPGRAKDPGDAAKLGADLFGWMVSGLPRGLKIKLGFIARTALAGRVASREETTEPQPSPPHGPVPETNPEEPAPMVAEIALQGGKVIFVTDHQPTWQAMTAEGKPVFSSNELQRLKAATATMSAEERLEAALRAIEVKEMFGGYIKAGRTVDAGE